ncbi:MAG: inorganic phosphate transporter [Sulfurimonadaceae bacterium]|jgi:PiT family inorganic phosphate transporter/low-affinity inorganic phosphate transporter|nr:inorganic phosphate transporter [Sulfurimonadaceae bacterium]
MPTLLDALSDVSTLTVVLLCISLLIALFYEVINGFHDAANAIAMIVYTNSLDARNSVLMSGIMNFLGVMIGGIGVAYTIVHLLPLDVLVSSDKSATLVMIFSLLLSAMIWNLSTWYFGLPTSSSHALIGSLIGVSAIFGVMNGFELAQSINWSVVYIILGALALSPLVGFGGGYLFMWLSRKYITTQKFYKSPESETKRKRPNFWMRMGIIATGAGVSFAHGSNDGQKGMGIIMIILMGILPSYYALNMESKQYKILQVHDSAQNLAKYYKDNKLELDSLIDNNTLRTPLKARNEIVECSINQVYETTSFIAKKLDGIESYSALSESDRWRVHTAILCSNNFFEQFEKTLPASQKDKKEYISIQRKVLLSDSEYVPKWVIIAVALSLGLGTMIGYKRVLVTIGEKIGTQPISYMQGSLSQAVSMVTILLANITHAPVSTTHIVSSSIAGTMVAEPGASVQKSTLRAIVLSWIFTLPTTAILSSSIYFMLSKVFI